MIKFLIHTNCQGHGIATFLKMAPNASDYQISEIPQLVQFYQGIDPAAHPELPKSEQERMIREADIILYHAKDGKIPEDLTVNERAQKIPLSVIYNSAYFMYGYDRKEDWEPVFEHARCYGIESACDYAIKDHDFGYVQRFNECLEKMKQKEEHEGVPEEIRMSHLFGREGETTELLQPLRTYNHPTSYVFLNWTIKILRLLSDNSVFDSRILHEASINNNMAGLPCEMSACTGAQKYMGIQWGGRPEDQVSCTGIAKERLERFMHEF